MKKYIVTIFITIFIIPFCYGQYSISGYIHSEKQRNVYLSLLRYDEEFIMTDGQILFSTQTDSTGYFEFKGHLLSEKDKYYRIHSNTNDDKFSLQLVNTDSLSNFHNFVFSNNDTIHFSRTKDFWFSNSINTNLTDKEFEKLKVFSRQLLKEVEQNKHHSSESVNNFAKQLKQYSQKYTNHPLLDLLTISTIERNGFDIKKDFENNPDFYLNLQQKLKDYYSENSYYLQYQDELSKISYSIIDEKYKKHKLLNHLLVLIIIVLSIALLLVLKKMKSFKQNLVKEKTTLLTKQEKKIAGLICEDKTNKEIADSLFVSLSTVKTHISNLYSKLEVANRKDFLQKFKNHTWY